VTERTLLSEILLACSRGASRLFRINSGQGWTGRVLSHTPERLVLEHPRPFHAAPKGFSDLIGWRTVTVTPDMIGKRIAVFCAVEVKTGSVRLTDEQRALLDAVRAAGGVGACVRSVDEAREAVGADPQQSRFAELDLPAPPIPATAPRKASRQSRPKRPTNDEGRFPGPRIPPPF
jgi:hypothetical protein